MEIYNLYETDTEFFYALLEANKQEWDYFLFRGIEFNRKEVNEELNKWY